MLAVGVIGAESKTLSGCWLRHLQQRFGDAVTVPACLVHFRECRGVALIDTEHLVGKGLTRALYTTALTDEVPVPRATRAVSAERQQHLWRSVHAKGLPVDSASTWHEAVHHVLPTAIRHHPRLPQVRGARGRRAPAGAV